MKGYHTNDAVERLWRVWKDYDRYVAVERSCHCQWWCWRNATQTMLTKGCKTNDSVEGLGHKRMLLTDYDDNDGAEGLCTNYAVERLWHKLWRWRIAAQNDNIEGLWHKGCHWKNWHYYLMMLSWHRRSCWRITTQKLLLEVYDTIL